MYIRVETEDAVIDRTITDPGKGHIAEIMFYTTEEEEIILTEVTGLIIELGVYQEMIMEIEGMKGLIIDKVTENFRQDCGEQRYRARSISQDQDRSR